MKFSKSLIGIAAFAAVSVANAGPILIVSGLSQTSEVGTTTAVMNNLQALQVAAGNTVTILDTLPVNLAPYSQVWDIRFDNVSALTGAEQAKYTSYLQSGGGLFLMGENSSFLTRDNSIDGPEVVHAPFTGPNPVTTVTYAASGCFTSKGSGAWITARADESMGAGIAFGVGSLSNAIAGALTTILDVNFMMNQFDLPASQNLTKNLIQFVGNQVNPVPEPGILALLGIAAVGAGLTRKRKSS